MKRYQARQVDFNAPYISASGFCQQPNGAVKTEKFLHAIAPSASNYFGKRERDLFYLKLDESRYQWSGPLAIGG